MNAKSRIGLVAAAVAVSLLFDVLALEKGWPTLGAYLIVRAVMPLMPPGPVQTDAMTMIVWAVDAVVYVSANFVCCLAILYVIFRIWGIVSRGGWPNLS
jgi:hypothetical protein